MSRNEKYSKELKTEILNRYLYGESASMLANEYGMTITDDITIIRCTKLIELI